MTTVPAEGATSRARSPLLAVAWIGTLLAGYLPVILWRELLGGEIAATLPFRLGVLLALLALTFAWRAIAPLRRLFLLILVLYLADEVARPWIAASAPWQRWFGAGQTA